MPEVDRAAALLAVAGAGRFLGHRLPKEWWRPRVLPKLLPELPTRPILALLLRRKPT